MTSNHLMYIELHQNQKAEVWDTRPMAQEKRRPMAFRAKYRTVPNTPASIKQHEDQGFEVCGYSEYSADGFPSKAEMRKYVRVPDFHRDADGEWNCHTCGGVGICSCISGTNDPICDCGNLAFGCTCGVE